ncbi:NAD(P)-dependent oxidoreductase [Allorhizobium sp. NPDC080224]|uniref:precorrin-2 dehydrogenase n=1 Tax=Rhizobium rosettiformans TaxID=1368430 RepID=A0ABX7ES42_9HYPH|nr:NAD(P)-dependent oxidoreductase [Rhizobium rosettiformans]QRF51149.1 siroheme synthase [Rhizobium rosettiformans]
MRNRSSQRSDPAARIEPLAKLPLFFDLQGKRALVAGGTDAAAWKAELLAACGARVEVFAAAGTVGDVMAELARAEKVTIRDTPWHIGVFAGASMAIADCDTDDEARAFACAARAAGVPFNVIDKPAFCQFQFGSIVNRSPVILAISTDGAAPILAQAIRRRVETLLPPSLKGWAALAQGLRDTVNLHLAPGPRRRAFWERFVDRCFSSARPPGETDRQAVVTDMDQLCHMEVSGSVALVGSGPGDAEMLTLKAVRTLQAADIILFDESVSQDVLELARREAKRMLVSSVVARDDTVGAVNLHDTIVGMARNGKRVVLLRAGYDGQSEQGMMDFGVYRRHGIQCELVQGIAGHSAEISLVDLCYIGCEGLIAQRLV